ncbi:MAG: hypothetical protein COU31_02280 [Candidatus Magasanikbacteria bacterium CG10_big_fil_rev_8_21_14_0_10_40_10]|uniref:RNA polymerase sigma factor n=1 Tax=Candidatus Magasanikbacteria bacterium CG10_big_fil_rev_8_21_14_0_10_40_10 TaxID=1974648 RepID=A0A2M6W433_9BACT|nr:MAG: hypothetical protein COU31_02280 [Candidatus Magasanikbacteria bacterium CG10_big_fil_rev_8_21_14_0_10_40_10]
MDKKTEILLIKQAQKGNKDALGRLWQEITPKLYGYLLNVLKNKPLADDILSETWLKAINALDRYKPSQARFSAWLFAIARNQCRQYWRVNQPVGLENIEPAKLSDSSQLEKTTVKIIADNIIERLDKKDRELLRLKYIAQLSHREIAALLEISIISARVYVHRALKRAKNLANQLNLYEI